jgi:hypothetical protein
MRIVVSFLWKIIISKKEHRTEKISVLFLVFIKYFALIHFIAKLISVGICDKLLLFNFIKPRKPLYMIS